MRESSMEDRRSRSMAVWLTAALIGGVYALPLVLAYAHHGALMHVSNDADIFYSMRAVEVARGGSLGNPYLWENQNAVRWLPALSVTVIGSVSRISGIPPLTVLAISRVLFPVAIFLLTYRLAIALNLAPGLALVAATGPALVPPAAASLSFLGGWPVEGAEFLRYFRTISSASHVAFFMLALVLLHAAWRRGALAWLWVVAAGIGLALLAETPMFYWTIAFTGVAILAAVSPADQRRATLLVFLTGIVLASTSIYHSLRVFHDPDVEAALLRTSQITLQRAIEPDVVRRFAESLPPILVLWIFRKKNREATVFLLPFLIPPVFFLFQSLVTSCQVEAYHWTYPLVPLWSLGFAFGAQAVWPRLCTARCALSGIALLAVAGTIWQVSEFKTWDALRKREPERYSLDLRMPQTLAWLEGRTPPNSVVLSNDAIMFALPLFTHNKVFGSDLAFFYTVSEPDVILRTWYENVGPPRFLRSPPFRCDYYLGTGRQCDQLSPSGMVYRNPLEHTCVWSFAQGEGPE